MKSKTLTKSTWDLSHLMMMTAQMRLFITAGIYDVENKCFEVESSWAGDEPKLEEGQVPSRAPLIGPMKALQLLTLPANTEFALTPVPGLGLGPEYQGGVLQLVDRRRYVVTASAFSGVCDLLQASSLIYAMQQEVRFHHFGKRHVSKEAMLAAVQADEKRLGTKSIHSTTGKDNGFHHRYYIPLETSLGPNGVCWVEHQFFPEGNQTPGVHWDVATMHPLDLLSFVGTCLRVEPTTWEAGENDPSGLVAATNRDGVEHAIMARSRWWEVK